MHSHVVYLTKPGTEFDVKPITAWVVADLTSIPGVRLALQVLRRVVC